MATLEVRSLTKWFGPVLGIEGVSFALERGEIFGYLGPNGAGKTTTIRCIMGLIRPGGGEVLALGEPVVSGRATRHHRMGYLPGEFRLWPGVRAGRSLRVLASLGGGDGARPGACNWRSDWNWTWTARWASSPRAIAKRSP